MNTDKPNVVLPLATSYNERGVAGYTHTVTNSEDQRKLNAIYEVSKNPATGRGTVVLTKRPGVEINGSTYGVSSQVNYLAIDTLYETTKNYGETTLHAVISVLNSGSTSLTISNLQQTTTITSTFGDSGPAYVDMTNIGNVPTIVIENEGIGTAGGKSVWFSNNVSGGTSWAQITHANFTSKIIRGKLEHVGGFAFYLDSANLIRNSSTNTLANWGANDFLAKQIQQDDPVGLMRWGELIVAGGRETSELFFNAGHSSGSPLGRIVQKHRKVGIVPTVHPHGTHYYARTKDRIYFVGRESGAKSASFFSFNGSDFEEVSSPYIDKIISEKIDSIYSVGTIGFQGEQGIYICFTPPTQTSHYWLMFFPRWKEWFEWSSDVISPVNSGHFHLGAVANKLYNFGPDVWTDNGSTYTFSTQFKLVVDGASKNKLIMYGLDADTASTTCNISTLISTNYCSTFTNLQDIDISQDRKVNFRGGSFRNAHLRLSYTGAHPIRFHNFLARIE